MPTPNETETSYDTPDALAEVAARYISEVVQVIESTPPEDQRRPDMLRLKLEVSQTVALIGIVSAADYFARSDDVDDVDENHGEGGEASV